MDLAVLRVMALIVFCTGPAFSGEMWCFLKDGRVAFGDPSTDPIQARTPSDIAITIPKDQCVWTQTQTQIDTMVDTMLKDLEQGRNIDAHTTRFKSIKFPAAKRLIQRIKDPAASDRLKLAILFQMQFCWAIECEVEVLPLARSKDADIRRCAFAALVRNTPENLLATMVIPLVDDPDINIARPWVPFVLRYDPNATRLQRFLADQASWEEVSQVLPRYYSPGLTSFTLKLLALDKPEVVQQAVMGLIAQNADGKETRLAVRSLLKAPQAAVREIAAEYFAWHGRGDAEWGDTAALEAALKIEADLYTQAALKSALHCIRQRESTLPADALAARNESFKPNQKPVEKAENPYLGFSSDAKPDWSAGWRLLRSADLFEPNFTYGKGEPSPRFEARNQMLRTLFGAPALQPVEVDAKKLEKAVADQCMPPVRNYFDPKRQSYGFAVGQQYQVFANSVHVGDDNSWRQAGRAVVSIAAGVVCEAAYIPSWGHIVIVEHHTADGEKFCSLYAHLGALLRVQEGQVVSKGELLGTIGRPYTVENGGYNSHLHFGIHRGPFHQASRWIGGYADPAAFSAGNTGWENPQEFLKTRVSKP